MSAYWRTPAYRAAVRMPYHVSMFASWSSDPTTVGFVYEDEARTFASLRPEPIIDLVRRNVGILGARRMLAHPSGALVDFLFDDFPDTRA